MKAILKIFVKDNCSGCVQAHQIALWVKRDFPQLKVEIVNIDDPQALVPEAVFATPTYMLNNSIVSLGNPGLLEVAGWATKATLSPV